MRAVLLGSDPGDGADRQSSGSRALLVSAREASGTPIGRPSRSAHAGAALDRKMCQCDGPLAAP
eukprot:scaffold1219_cov400-Prasinococcus_capsulatus_cf.AAC.24